MINIIKLCNNEKKTKTEMLRKLGSQAKTVSAFYKLFTNYMSKCLKALCVVSYICIIFLILKSFEME